jgi:hypothetical protein
MIPVDGIFGRVTHGRQEDSAAVSLGVEVSDMRAGPRLVSLEVFRIVTNGDGTGRAIGRATTATDTTGVILDQKIVSVDVFMNLIGALADTHLAADALGVTSINDELVE